MVIAGGGTGGHLYPGIAVARELLARRPDAEVSFAGTAQGIEARVVDMHTIKPLDAEAVVGAAASDRVMTVEEHNVIGGLGGAVAEVMAQEGCATRLHRHGIADTYSLIGPPTHLYAHYRLDAEGIAAEARELLAADRSA